MSRSGIRHNSISQAPHSDDKQEVAALWQEIFQDSDEFVNLFFNRVYKPENTLVIKRDNRIISALHMVPYRIKIGHDIFPSAYVCGVCTLPSERGKGIMNTLMTEAMETMRQKGYLISTLIPAEPWLFDFYKKFGYIHPVNYKTETYLSGAQPIITRSASTPPNTYSLIPQANLTGCYTFAECTSDKYFPFFERKQHERRCAVLHNAHDFETIIRDLKYEKGSAWILFNENNPVGIAFAKPENRTTIHIKEILYDNLSVKEALIGHILTQYNARTAKVRTPVHSEEDTLRPGCEQIRPYGLACTLTQHDKNISDLYMTLMLD
ncbi:MAG: GNAT family N-acetyltransferase [Tannerella sp.]|jgi:predicted acetyltransferase|nr:GNAT family N-acetyltransferase [Tannerella sp.]